MNIRVLLVDDHRMFREALAAMLDKTPDIDVVAQADDGLGVIELARVISPDLVVMDIGMPGLNGVEATRQLLAIDPRLRVIAVSAHFEKRYVTEMLEAGASGYVVKAAAADELLRAIHAVAKGQTYLSSEAAATLVDAVYGTAQGGEATPSVLGKRERQVLRLLTEGHSSPEIAAQLHISPATVDVHRRNIMQKLDLHNVAELTKWALRHGMTSI